MTDDNNQTSAALSHLLADSYSLYLKTHNYHWNVTGPMFNTLHTMFETQYTELALAVDEIAERIRALGHRAPGSYREFAALTKVADAEGSPAAEQMIEDLVHDLAIVVSSAKTVFAAAEGTGDPASADLAVRRIEISEKHAWMLRSHLS
jgi:starvation-inducible DNA-binding protein